MRPTRRNRAISAVEPVCRPKIEALEQRWLLSGLAKQVEFLDRGVVAFRTTPDPTPPNPPATFGDVYVDWRMLGTDPSDIEFNLYRSDNGGPTNLVYSTTPAHATTDYVDHNVSYLQSHVYSVKPVIGGIEQATAGAYTFAGNAVLSQHLDIPLSPPPIIPLPDGQNSYTYNANDASVADLDGDGQYEIILKWDPSNSHDSSQDGYTGDTYFDAYKLDGTRLWRIDLGRNIRAGAHYTQFIAYDLDGDGKAEIAMKTAPGTLDGLGNPVLLAGDHYGDDYRNSTTGRINTGPEYLTIFNGATGAAMATTAFKPDRVNTSTWGDDYGNRQDRILMAVAYLDGERPSLVFGRGLFPGQSSGHAVRNELTAWDWRSGTLSLRWWFHADNNASSFGIPNVNTGYIGQGNYEMHPADVDGDGKDEIVFGSMTVNDNGTGLYSTGLGHGDALAVSDMDPLHAGEEIYMPMESPGSNGHITANVHDAATGAILWNTLTTPPGSTDPDVGRGNAFDIDPNYPGFETWDAYNPSIYNIHNNSIVQAKPSNMFINMGIWWDADPMRELEDGTTISNWNPGVGRVNLVSSGSSGINNSSGLSSNNGTKSTPCLIADIFGDWREEVIWRKSDNSAIQIWSTTIPATNRMYTLMHDTQYRESVAWQNVGYNQPTATSFYLGSTEATGTQFPVIPAANIYTVQASSVNPRPPVPPTATPVNIHEIDVSWPAAAGAINYTLLRAANPVGPYSTIASNLTTTSFADATVFGSTNYYYAVWMNTASGPSPLSATGSATTPTIFTYQAESALVGGGTVSSSTYLGSHGSGYVDFPSSGSSGFVEFDNVYGDVGGAMQLRLRYALAGTTPRSGSLTINGVSQNVTFDPSGGPTGWLTLELSNALNSLNNNTIRLQATGTDLPNIDELQINVIDTIAPTVVGQPVYSFSNSPNTLLIAFSEDVSTSLVSSDLVVNLLDASGNPIGSVPATLISYIANVATFALLTPLADGNYRAKFASGGVTDPSGNPVSESFAYDFFFLGGDANHDRRVDVNDLVVLSNNWLGMGKTFDEGDFDYDGDVDAHDLGILAQNWLQKLDPPALPSSPVPVATRARSVRQPTRVIDLVNPA